MLTPRRSMEIHHSLRKGQHHQFLSTCRNRSAWGLIIAFALSLLVSSHTLAAADNPHNELHIIFDTHSGSSSEENSHVDLNRLRLVSGLLPSTTPIHLWQYKGYLMPLKPAYMINKNRDANKQTLPPAYDKAKLLPSISALTQTFSTSKKNRDIVLVSTNPRHASKLLTPEVEELATKLQSTHTRFSSLILNSQQSSPVYQLLATITSGTSKTIDHTGPYSYDYLKFIEHFASVNYLPLHETLMKIDANIHEATLVMFKDPKEANDIEIIPPLKDPFNISNAPGNIRWVQTPTFDIINIDKPSKGTWQVFSDHSTEQRIFIDSDFIIKTNDFEPLIPAQSYQELHIELKENEQTVLSPDVLDYVAIKVSQIKDDLDQYAWFPADNGKNGDLVGNDGLFTIPLKNTLKHGEYIFQIDVDGKNFHRQKFQHIRTEENLAWVHSEYSSATNEYTTIVVPISQFLKPESIIINAIIHEQNNAMHESEIKRYNDYSWTITTKNANSLEINLAGTSPGGKTSSIWLPPIHLAQQTIDVLHEPTQAQELPVEEAVTPSSDTPAPIETMAQPQHITLSEASTLNVTATLLLINILILTAVFFGLRRWKKYDNTWRTQLEGRLSYE